MAIVGFTKLEALFRKAASIDIKKGHAKEITDIAEAKLNDLLIGAEINANINGRDVIWESDLPITKGLQESIVALRKLEEEVALEDVLTFLRNTKPIKYALSEEVEAKLPELIGTILIVMAKIMKEIDDNDRALDHETIAKTKRILDLTL